MFVILSLVACVCNQVHKRFKTEAFFFTTNKMGCGALKLKPAVLVALLVKSPFSKLVVYEFAIAFSKPGISPTPIFVVLFIV